jgi:chromosome segregation ATPase
MFVDLPGELMLYTAVALLLGWLLGAVSTRLNEHLRAKRRDPRDQRILELEAKLRIAEGDSERTGDEISRLEEELKRTHVDLEQRDGIIDEQMDVLKQVQSDLKDSVIKTRELRAELAERATESVQAEAKIREVQTELSIAQASADLLATGALQYAVDDEGDEADDDMEPIFSRTAL